MITEKILRLPCYMVDCRSLLRPTAFMDMAQQIGEDNAEEGGYGYRRLRDEGLAWVLSRQSVRFNRMPVFKETLKMQTWHRGVDGPFYIRDYRLVGEDGSVAVESTSSWVVINLESRAMVLPHNLSFDAKAWECAEPVEAMSSIAPRIMAPRGMEASLAAEHKVVYSDVDYNMHVNNVRYIGWALDALPGDLAYTHTLKELNINFNREVHPGETVSLYLYEKPSGEYFVEGKVEGRQAFIIRFVF